MLTTAMLYSKLPDIDDVTGLSDADKSCLEEIREVLKKHGRLNRFGVALLHRHFPLEEDEILVETCDAAKRELLLRPEKVKNMRDVATLETLWHLTDGQSLTGCRVECVKVSGKHTRKHVTRKPRPG